MKSYGSCCTNKYCLPHSTYLLPGTRQVASTFGKGILTFSPLPLSTRQQSTLAHHWAHESLAVPKKIAPPQCSSSMRLVTSVLHSLPWCNPPGSSLHWHSAEPIWLMLCQKRLLPHSTSLPPAMILATSAFRSFPWCDPLIPLSSLSELAAISNGTALSPQDSCCANKDCSPTVLLFHQPGDWPYQHSAAFRDAILLFLSPPS